MFVPGDAFYPLDLFYRSELSIMKEIRTTVKSDLHNLGEVISGKQVLSLEYEEKLKCLANNVVPKQWLEQTFPTGMNKTCYCFSLLYANLIYIIYTHNVKPHLLHKNMR